MEKCGYRLCDMYIVHCISRLCGELLKCGGYVWRVCVYSLVQFPVHGSVVKLIVELWGSALCMSSLQCAPCVVNCRDMCGKTLWCSVVVYD